ncbi:unnamed protein product, partial [Aphanomyces euteiches]
MRVFIPLALAASTVAALNQPLQDSPLVMLGHPQQDSMDFAVHPLRILKVQGKPRTPAGGTRHNGQNRRASGSSPKTSTFALNKSPNPGRIERLARGCGKVAGAVTGAVIGGPACAIAGLRGKAPFGRGRVGNAVMGAIFGPAAGVQHLTKTFGDSAAAWG